jgi:pimeloyl-ACP methyl ester carboxylesterase
MQSISTDLLEVAFEQGGPQDGPPVLLLHGWPDAPRGWNAIAARLQAEGWRTIAPHLRGCGPTQFLSGRTPRVGSSIALAQDAIDFADQLGLDRFAVVGHDWGARTAYTLAALFPQRITRIVALSVAFQPRGLFQVPGFDQSRRFWYQWFQCIDAGADKVAADPIGFARIQWQTWSPSSWFDEEEFARTAESFANPDWVAITLNAYRSRWREGEPGDPHYDALKSKLRAVETLATPTLMIQGLADNCDPPSESEGQEAHFTAGYERLLLENVGHFPHREAPDAVGSAILEHLRPSRSAQVVSMERPASSSDRSGVA